MRLNSLAVLLLLTGILVGCDCECGNPQSHTSRDVLITGYVRSLNKSPDDCIDMTFQTDDGTATTWHLGQWPPAWVNEHVQISMYRQGSCGYHATSAKELK